MASDAADQPRRALSETQPEFLARAILVTRRLAASATEDPAAAVDAGWSDEDEQRLQALAAGTGY
jgi:hypothetical protein